MHVRRSKFEFFESVVDLERAKKQLDYTEFTIHHVAPKLISIIIPVKLSLQNLLKQTDGKVDKLAEYSGLFRQVGVYLAFYSKEKKEACEFLNIYLQLCVAGSKRWAHASCLLGVGEMLDENYVKTERFDSALRVLSVVTKSSKNAGEIQFLETFVTQQLAAIKYRIEDYRAASDIIDAVVKTYAELLADKVPFAAQASASHLQGQILSHMDPEAALESFVAAKKSWDEDYEQALNSYAQDTNNSQLRIVAFPNAKLPGKHQDAVLTDTAIKGLEQALCDKKILSPRR